MKILQISKYPPIQGGVSAQCFWFSQALAEAGHSVTILTNSLEVESDYRINLTTAQFKLLSGFRKRNSIRFVSTEYDAALIYIPQTSPHLSKLISLGLKEIEDNTPDLIYSSYLEPYGVAALVLIEIDGRSIRIQSCGKRHRSVDAE